MVSATAVWSKQSIRVGKSLRSVTVQGNAVHHLHHQGRLDDRPEQPPADLQIQLLRKAGWRNDLTDLELVLELVARTARPFRSSGRTCFRA